MQKIKITSNFSSYELENINERFQAFRSGIFNALLKQEIPIELQAKVVNNFIEQGLIK